MIISSVHTDRTNQVLWKGESMNVTRRQFGLGLVGTGIALGVSACGGKLTTQSHSASAAMASPLAATGVARKYLLEAGPTKVDLGGKIVDTWTYGNSIPGKFLRATAGDRVQVAFTNNLPDASSVHWHGLAIQNNMDGVPGLTTPETSSGETFHFDFVIPNAGTHWFHPHTGVQMDRGLYAPFIVDDPREPGAYDHEWILILDDWTDGIGPNPEQILAGLKAAGGGGSMSGTNMSGSSGAMNMGGMDGGDVNYPLYLINGKSPSDPDVLSAKPGQRVRLRIINASADTIFSVALDRHDMTVTHTDGYAVEPMRTSAIKIGMGERYDATVTLNDGVFPLVAVPYGKSGIARALIRTGGGGVPNASYTPKAMGSTPLTVDSLRASAGTALPSKKPDSTQELVLAGGMQPYKWTINGRTYDNTVPLTINQGDTGQVRITNQTMMPTRCICTVTHSNWGKPAAVDRVRTRYLCPPWAPSISHCSRTTRANG